MVVIVVGDAVRFVGAAFGEETGWLQADENKTATISEIDVKMRVNFFISILLYISSGLELVFYCNGNILYKL